MRPRAAEKPYFCFWFLFVIYLAKREENHETLVRATQEIEIIIYKENSLGEEDLRNREVGEQSSCR